MVFLFAQTIIYRHRDDDNCERQTLEFESYNEFRMSLLNNNRLVKCVFLTRRRRVGRSLVGGRVLPPGSRMVPADAGVMNAIEHANLRMKHG